MRAPSIARYWALIPESTSASGSSGSGSPRTSKLKSPRDHVNIFTTAASIVSRQSESIALLGQVGVRRDQRAHRMAAALGLVARRIEGVLGEEAPIDQNAAQILRTFLERRAADLAIEEKDAASAPGGLQCEDAGFLRQADDLQDVPEAQVLEVADQAHHPLPNNDSSELQPHPTRRVGDLTVNESVGGTVT